MENCDSEVPHYRLEDLQLAAELGKSLLERNKELDTQMKAYKSKADEQEREIIHLRKLINVMGEENDSRLKVYEKLDAMLQDLERANERLNAEKIHDRRQIKMLTDNAEGLEARCEELTQQLSLARQSLNKLDRYKQERNTNTPTPQNGAQEMAFPEIQSIVLARHDNIVLCHDNLALSLAEETFLKNDDSEDLIRLLGEMETIMRDYLTERRRCVDLEEQLGAIIEENKRLQDLLANVSPSQNMDMSVQEEFCLLDEVRQGQMCIRCLAKINKPNHQQQQQQQLDEQSSLQASLQNSNPYQDVVEKYEALLEVKQTSSAARIQIEAKKTSALNIPSAGKQQKDGMGTTSTTKKPVIKLTMAPMELWEAGTSFSGMFNNCSKNDFTYFASNAANFLIPQVVVIPPPPPREQSPVEVSAISQNLAVGNHVTNLESSPFDTTSTMEENVFAMKPLKRQVPENIPIAAGMKKKNRRKHHDIGIGNTIQNQPELQMGQCSVSAPVTRDFGHGAINRRVIAPPPSSPAFSNHLKGSAKPTAKHDAIEPKNYSISYAEVLRGATSSPSHVPSKFQSYIAQRSQQQTNPQKRH